MERPTVKKHPEQCLTVVWQWYVHYVGGKNGNHGKLVVGVGK